MNIKTWKDSLAVQGVPFFQHDVDFEKHPATHARLEQIKKFAKEPKGTITMAGPCGNGKTLSAIAIFAYHFLTHGIGARFLNSETLYQLWREESIKGHVSYLVEKISTCPLLILDDLGQGEISDSYKRFIYSVINMRWGLGKAMVITTNLVGREFRAIFGDAILSRISDGEIWKFNGKDHRIPKAETKDG